MIYYIFSFYVFVFVRVTTSLYNENCTGCYRESARKSFEAITLRHLYEVTILTNLSTRATKDIFASRNKCSGAIISSNLVITVASFFENSSKVEEYAVYVGHVIPSQKENPRLHQIDNIFKHPDFTNGSNMAIIKMKTDFAFDEYGCTMALLPDSPVDFTKTTRPICTILNRHSNALRADVISGVEVDILTKGECTDILRLSNITLPLNADSFCVKAHASPDELIDITGGSTCLCGGAVRGIITNSYSKLKTSDPIAVTDLGLHTTWIRSKIVNLNQISKSSIIQINYRLIQILFIVLLYCRY